MGREVKKEPRQSLNRKNREVKMRKPQKPRGKTAEAWRNSAKHDLLRSKRCSKSASAVLPGGFRGPKIVYVLCIISFYLNMNSIVVA